MRANRHVILGTAGHVDHGKTELVKALTGVNTDRLREEQTRGISIELGFAELTLPSGERMGLVDVPGHEKFVKAMVAGAAGMDLGMLVVAADEGVMPQTREHLEIMSLLGLQKGLVVITKADLADEETLQLVDAELDETLQHTFLQNAPRVRTSAKNKTGLTELETRLEELSLEVPKRASDTYFRLPIDRAFGMSGIGRIVTGTAWSGEVHVNENMELLPSGHKVRVRGIQVHGEKRQQALAGERVAINLHGVKQDDVERGMQLVTSGVLEPSYMLDVRLHVLPGFDRALTNRMRVRIHHGAAEVLGRVVLLDRDELRPGDTSPAQLRLESPLAADRGDRIVVRFYSPMRTLGGALVLDAHPQKHKRFREDVLEKIHVMEQGGPRDWLLAELKNAGLQGVAMAELQKARLTTAGKLEELVQQLAQEGELRQVGNRYYQPSTLEGLGQRLRRETGAFQKANPLSWGMGRAELQERLGYKASKQDFADLLQYLATQETQGEALHLRPDAVRLGSEDRQLPPEDAAILDQLEARLLAAGAAPPSPADLQEGLAVRNRLPVFVSLLEERGSIVRVTESLLYHRKALQEIETKLRGFLSGKNEMKMADFKNLTGLSRKFAVPLLEHFDRLGLTRRDGDVRRPGPGL